MASSSTPSNNIPAYFKLHIEDLQETKATIKSKKEKMEDLLREFKNAEAANNKHRDIVNDDDDTSSDEESFGNIDVPEADSDDDDDNKDLTADALASLLAPWVENVIEHLTEFIKFYDRKLKDTEKFLQEVEMFI